MKEAMFYEKLGDATVKCNLCKHRCRIPELKRGICGVRENRNGTLYTMVYGKAVARAVDPIEKKPLFHFLPASSAYSIATVGCNFRLRTVRTRRYPSLPSLRNPSLEMKFYQKRSWENLSGWDARV